ncbi:MAG: phosphoenolpyruvate carboxylase, partial [Fimbriimonadaceae bacterium]
YVDLDEDAKVELLTQELSNPRPLVPQRWLGSEDTEGVREVFRVIRRAHEKIGRSVIQAYVISMTHGVSDVLEVLLLAKDAGIVTYHNGEIASDVDVVPLLETIQDLANSEELLRELVSSDVYQQVLTSRGGLQEIMLGYSDSSKDGGYLAANASLYETQDRLSRFARENNLKVRFFHGRGGTVGRGGGRANRAILSQPPGSFSGQIRFTEQGEVISFRYGMPPIAHRHLEQIVGAVITASTRHGTASDDPEDWRQALRQLAEKSREIYRDFVYENDEFWPFYVQATPIARISHLPIASRPVMRPGKALVGMEGLRAIPWNFAWVQSRYMVPGWFGLGSALAWYTDQNEANLELLRDMYANWPFFKTAVENAELELARAEMDTARRYANRVDDPELGRRMHEKVEKEYQESVRQVEAVTERPLLEHSRIVRSTIEFRNPMVLPLNELQVGLAELWDERENQDRDIEPDLREATLQTMAGIAAAMQSTG